MSGKQSRSARKEITRLQNDLESLRQQLADCQAGNVVTLSLSDFDGLDTPQLYAIRREVERRLALNWLTTAEVKRAKELLPPGAPTTPDNMAVMGWNACLAEIAEPLNEIAQAWASIEHISAEVISAVEIAYMRSNLHTTRDYLKGRADELSQYLERSNFANRALGYRVKARNGVYIDFAYTWSLYNALIDYAANVYGAEKQLIDVVRSYVKPERMTSLREAFKPATKASVDYIDIMRSVKTIKSQYDMKTIDEACEWYAKHSGLGYDVTTIRRYYNKGLVQARQLNVE